MIVRTALTATLLALAACQTGPKGPGEASQQAYYQPQTGISSDGMPYPRP